MSQTLEESLFQRKQTAFLLSPDKSFARMLKTLWSPDVLEFTVFENGTRAIEHMFNEPPDLLVVDNRLTDISGREVANLVKSENVYRQLPGGHVRGPRGRGDPPGTGTRSRWTTSWSGRSIPPRSGTAST